MSLPITLIIDDPAPLINVYWWHVAEVNKTDHPVLASGEAVVRDVPVDFLRAVVEVIAKWNIGGKFSVLPYPAGLGKISAGWPGCNIPALNTWLDLVRTQIAPRMDITPEILTHAGTLDLDTQSILPQNERDWSRHQRAATLTPYISYALEILNEVDLEANGVTSPGDFGIAVEDEYQQAIGKAMKTVNGREQTWYFLHSTDASDLYSRVVSRDNDGWLVSIWSQVRDGFWNTMNVQEDSTAYINSVADAYLSKDGSQGRLAELFCAGTPMVLCTHWQSLFSNGRGTGLKALDEVCHRVHSTWGNQVEWTRCSELARRIVAGQWPTRI